MSFLTQPLIECDTIESIPGFTCQEKIIYLTNCNCCDRHQINKPKIFAPWHECASSGMMLRDEYVKCECKCRHMARIICRQCPDN